MGKIIFRGFTKLFSLILSLIISLFFFMLGLEVEGFCDLVKYFGKASMFQMPTASFGKKVKLSKVQFQMRNRGIFGHSESNDQLIE